MKTNTFNQKFWKASLRAGVLTACLLTAGTQKPVHAQGDVPTPGDVPVQNGRFSIEIRDASLADALNLLFESAGIRDRTIDASAQYVNIGTFSRQSITFDTAMQQLLRPYGYKYVKENGVYTVSPRDPAFGGFGGGFQGGMGRGGSFPGGG